MRRSIAELCVADQQNDPAILARWPGNKTSKISSLGSSRPTIFLMVAVEGGKILAVGSVTDSGSIGLNYVLPDARFRGVSRVMLGTLEARALAVGELPVHVDEHRDRPRFYLSNGYLGSGAAIGAFGTTSGYPMSKPLAAHLPTS